MEYKYELDKSSKKYECPGCGKKTFTRYVYVDNGHQVADGFGLCDRSNNCGHHHHPKNDAAFVPDPNIRKVERKPKQLVTPAPDYVTSILNSHKSPFHQFCTSRLNIPDFHFSLWKIGAQFDKTAFGIATPEKVLNFKFMAYTEEGKRDKSVYPEGHEREGEQVNFPYYLGKAYLKKHGYLKTDEEAKNWQDSYEFKRCFYGYHLFSTAKDTCIVESEKSAVLGAYFFPSFNWLATGGNNGLTFEQFEVFYNYDGRIFYLVDNDQAGIEKSKVIDYLQQIDAIREKEGRSKSLNLFPDKENGYDIADAIIYDGFQLEEDFKALLENPSLVVSKAAPVAAGTGSQDISGFKLSSMVLLRDQLEEAKEKVDTLYLATGISGELSSDLEELFLIGLDKFDDLYEGVSRKKLKQELIDLIYEIDPVNIVLLTPADVQVCKYKKEKDLFTYPKWVVTNIISFREALQFAFDREKTKLRDAFITFVNNTFYPQSNHIAELLANHGQDKEKILESLNSKLLNTKYFTTYKLTDWNKNKIEGIERHFGVYSVEDFWDTYNKQAGIAGQEFVWKKYYYQFDSGKNKVIQLRHQDADLYLWINDKTAKISWKSLNGDTLIREVKKFNSDRLKQKYGNGFLDDLLEVEGLTYEPDNFRYSPLVYLKREGKEFVYYNMYQPLAWTPAPGSIDSTIKYLKHVFTGNATVDNPILGDTFTIALDWLTILYRYPKNILPVIGLISKKQQTGKTTFMDWLQVILGTNLANMTMERYLGNFNSHASFKTVICIDEFEESALDKSTAKNKFKNQATAKNVMVEFKGIDTQVVPNYAKVVFATNSEKPLNLEEEDINRFWIVPVPVLKDKDRDPDLLKKMSDEIPAFLDFLAKREIVHPKVSRMWFDPNLFYTEYFQQIVSSTKPYHVVEVENYLKDVFLTFRISQFRINPEYILEMMYRGKARPKYQITKEQVKEVLRAHGYQKADGNATIYIPIGFVKDEVDGNKPKIKYYEDPSGNKPSGRYFTLLPQDWLDEEDLQEFNKGLDEVDLTDFNPLDKPVELTEDNLKQEIFNYLNSLPDNIYSIESQVNLLTGRYRTTLITPKVFTDTLVAYIDHARETNYSNGCPKDITLEGGHPDHTFGRFNIKKFSF